MLSAKFYRLKQSELLGIFTNDLMHCQHYSRVSRGRSFDDEYVLFSWSHDVSSSVECNDYPSKSLTIGALCTVLWMHSH
jgi:hypothetical protein